MSPKKNFFQKKELFSNFLLFVKSSKSSFYCPSIDLVFFITYKLDSNNDFNNLFTNNANESNVIKLKLTLKKITKKKLKIITKIIYKIKSKTLQSININ